MNTTWKKTISPIKLLITTSELLSLEYLYQREKRLLVAVTSPADEGNTQQFLKTVLIMITDKIDIPLE